MSTNYTPNLSLPQWEGSDRIMRAEFNDAFAAIDTGVAAKSEVITGTYIGDGQAERIIDLGFRPRAVLIAASGGLTVKAANTTWSAQAEGGTARSTLGGGYLITDNGFAVSSSDGCDYHRTNVSAQ